MVSVIFAKRIGSYHRNKNDKQRFINIKIFYSKFGKFLLLSMSSLIDSVEFFDKDALIGGESLLSKIHSILDKKSWVDNMSDRFFASFHYLFPVFCVILIFLSNLALFVFPNFIKNERAEISTNHYVIFFSLMIIVTCLAKGLKWFLPERALKSFPSKTISFSAMIKYIMNI
jgi:hypothetical protein